MQPLYIITEGGEDQKVGRQADVCFSMEAQESTQDSPKDGGATNKT
jgi:hypothetical protein